MIASLLTVCLAIPGPQRLAEARPQNNDQPKHSIERSRPGCGAGNARENRDSTPLLGGPGAFQHVPVLPDAGRRGTFFVAYSAKSSGGPTPCNKRVNNSLISVFELSPLDPSGSDLLVYGTGYGCRYLNGDPCNGAEFLDQNAIIDASNVNDIVRRCLERRGTVKIDVVVPHSHADHINPEFLHELEALDFQVQAIMTHADDFGATVGVDRSITTSCPSTGRWGNLQALIQPFGTRSTVPCLQTVCTSRFSESPLTYLGVAGNIWFRERGGHTAGATDLVIDAGGDPNKRFIVYGSSPPGTGPATSPNCMAPACNVALSGVRQRFSAHGNVRYVERR